MKSYTTNEVKTWNWLKKQKYIHSSNSLGDGKSVGWKLLERLPINCILHEPAIYPNPIDMVQVMAMLTDFYPFGFVPIRLNIQNKLLDGQHRLKFAQLCGFKFIDVWIDFNATSSFALSLNSDNCKK